MRTSVTDPLRIDVVEARPFAGRIGMTICPGKRQQEAMSGAWSRDLTLDLSAISAFGARALVTLMEPDELVAVGVRPGDLAAGLRALGMSWLHLPIPDGGVPDGRFEAAWGSAGADLRERLRAGEALVIHCKGGLGRTGTIAARLLVELGCKPERAIADVRRARPGAIETAGQERYVRSLRVPPC